MGMVVPLVCYLLILRAWRGPRNWETNGSWWGFAVLAGSAALMFLRDQMLLIVTVNKDWLLQLPPLPLVAVVYAAGMVLLFWRHAPAQGCLVPGAVHVGGHSGAADLQPAHRPAAAARFGDRGPGLGPCARPAAYAGQAAADVHAGVRHVHRARLQRHSRRDHAGLAAIVVSYLYRFRWYVYAPIVVGAVLLGYLFNFLRLCLLVVYYKIALPYPWLQHHAKIADYVIGGCLFVCALALFFTVANKLRNDPK
jgi:exosortase/archaeosortase family protein